MKKGQVYEGIVEYVDFPNKGILHIDGVKVVVKDALGGQKIRFSVNKVRKEKCEGRLLEVLERSDKETAAPPCKSFGTCGGCLFQTLPYEEQLAMKEQQVKSLLDSVCEDYEFQGIKGSPKPWGYRNKMEFSFGDEYKDGPLALGMHKKGSFYDIVTVDECRIVNRDYNQVLSLVLEHFTELGMPYYKKLAHTGILRHLLVRRAEKTGELLIALVTTSEEAAERTSLSSEKVTVLQRMLKLDELTEKLLELPLEGTIAGILHIINDGLADMVRSDETILLYGKDYLTEELLGLSFKITPFSFFQTNSPGAEVLYDTVRSFVGDTKDKVIFDLYSGTGTIAQMLAPVASHVVGVEIVGEAVEAARINAGLNGLSNCEFISGDVLKVLDELTDKPDFIVLDPPRDGIHPKALKKIIDFGLEKMVYISCKPTSLVRDLVVMKESGYYVEKAVAVDMFPWTGNVETVVLLSQLRQKPDDYINVDVDVAELEGTSAETKATYEKIKKYVAEHNDGMKVSSLYIAQVKRKCGIELAENFNLPKSADARQPQCPKDKEEAIVEALKAFQMI